MQTITALKREDKTSRAGKPYTSLALMIDGVWYNGFGNSANGDWKVGDSVDIELTQKPGPNGKVFNNWIMPTNQSQSPDKMKWINDELLLLRGRVEALEKKIIDTAIPADKIVNNDEEVPF